MAGIGELDWQGGEGQYRLELTLRSLFAHASALMSAKAAERKRAETTAL